MWLGGGLPLNPYLKGIIIDFILNRMKPKDLVLPPCPEVVFQGEADNLEYTLYRNWMSSWLKYIHWYYSLFLNPDSVLREFLNAPIVQTSWKVTYEDPVVFRYGLLWRLHDMCKEVEPLLALSPLEFSGWVRGGEGTMAAPFC